MSQRNVAAFVWLISSCATAGSAPNHSVQPAASESSPPMAAEPTESPPTAAEESNASPIAAEATTPLMAAGPVDDDERFRDVVTDQGQRAHGLYFTELTVARLGAKGIIHAVRGAGLDAAVIDIKDQDGRVAYDTHVEVLAPERHVVVRDMPALLRELKSAGVYTIARIACFSDETLPRKRPDLSVMDSRPSRAGEIWNAHRNNSWLDPSNETNQDMVVAIASEAESLGFDEVQLDYIRFPVDAGTVNARFPSQGERTRSQVLLGLLRRVDETLHIPLGVDVFGVAAIRRGDPEGLGQSLDEWAKYVEVFSPMLYVNGMKPWMRNKTQGRAGLLVEMAVHALRQRVGGGPVIRPFLQAFERGADYFNSEFIAEQIRGARSGG
ncbi:MAG TPA: putative glycoside hydrolase, partial [Polyangiales bacterium]